MIPQDSNKIASRGGYLIVIYTKNNTPYCKLQLKFHPKVVVETGMSMYLFKGGSMLLCVF